MTLIRNFSSKLSSKINYGRMDVNAYIFEYLLRRFADWILNTHWLLQMDETEVFNFILKNEVKTRQLWRLDCINNEQG